MGINTNNIEVLEGDITEFVADAIVIPATPRLQYHGVGIQKKVEERGGAEIFYELEQVGTNYARTSPSKMRKWGDTNAKVPPCSAHITCAGDLPSSYIIHVVAMDFDENGTYFNEDVLGRSVQNSVSLGEDHNLRSLAFYPLGDGSIPVEKTIVREFRKSLSKCKSIEKLVLIFDK